MEGFVGELGDVSRPRPDMAAIEANVAHLRWQEDDALAAIERQVDQGSCSRRVVQSAWPIWPGTAVRR